MRSFSIIALTLLTTASTQAAELHVEAAANLSNVLPDLSAVFERQAAFTALALAVGQKNARAGPEARETLKRFGCIQP